MRIGIMCLAGCGGSARIATQLAVQFALRGHRVHLFSRSIPFGDLTDTKGLDLHTIAPDLDDRIHPAKLYIDWSENDLQAFLLNILDVIADEGLDVLHFHYAIPFAFIAAEVKHRLGWSTPILVGTLHGTDVSIYGRLPRKGAQLALALNEMDELSTVSRSHARLATDILCLPESPTVIPNFVDLSKFHPLGQRQAPGTCANDNISSLARFREPTHNERPRIAHVSNFRPVKDPQSMARIFLDIRKQMDAELWLIGDGPEMQAVRAILQGSIFRDDIYYWSLQSDVATLLAHADLLLMTSLSESFCLAALEAMACGIPVLATDVGGLPEVVMRGQTGFLFPVGDHKLAARLAVNILTDHHRHLAMSRTAAHHAENFGYNRIVPAYEDMYRNLLSQKAEAIADHSAVR